MNINIKVVINSYVVDELLIYGLIDLWKGEEFCLKLYSWNVLE